MNVTTDKEIGGYFGLELAEKYDNIKDAIALDCARNCLRYIIRTYNIKEIFIPYYTCPTVWQAIKKEDCKIKFYHINKDFLPTIDFDQNSFILYTNYFGICAENVKEMAKKYKNLIVDNAQAFYMPKYGIASFNSIRKFFGTPDGALLYCDKKNEQNLKQGFSYERFSYMLKRIDVNADFGYSDFCNSENLLAGKDIKSMSKLTKYLFNSIDIESAKKKRLENFKYLNSKLYSSNELNINIGKDDVPMFYPYFSKNENLRTKLIKNKIYVEHFWQPTPKNFTEGIFQKYIIPLPIDQRYGKTEMQKIIEIISPNMKIHKKRI